eukprot:TRINITY_DN10702_c0_g1_i1.p1 TRINITY_DN10702_c0_g1~~TRINITY_DN10702_c0_g1_i1.p1  ORF type:complete len:583 (+),score=165.06 TRINITY_DN10702_c0_g1_i1:60-1808(+)
MMGPPDSPHFLQFREIVEGSAKEFVVFLGSDNRNPPDLSLIARSFVFVLSGTNQLTKLLEWALEKEFNEKDTADEILFEGIKSFLLSEYFKHLGSRYIEDTIGKCLSNLSDTFKKRVIEINPSLSPHEYEENTTKLKELADNVLSSVYQSYPSFPSEFHHLFNCLLIQYKKKFSTEYLQYVTKYFFEVFVVLPIMNSEAYSLKEMAIPRTTRTYLAKLLRSTASRSLPSNMSKFTDYVEGQQPSISAFISEILTAQATKVVPCAVCTQDAKSVAWSCLHYYVYWNLQYLPEETQTDNPFFKAQRVVQEWELVAGKPDHVEDKDLRVDFNFQPKTGRRQSFFKRMKPTSNLPKSPHHEENKILFHKHQEDTEESDKFSNESSSAAESEFSLSDADKMESSRTKKGGMRNITTTTAQQLQDKKIAEFNSKLFKALIYRQERESQVRQAALKLKSTTHQSLDDDLWDWDRAYPLILRTSKSRPPVSSDPLPFSPNKKLKKLGKTERRPPRKNQKSIEINTKPLKRLSQRSAEYSPIKAKLEEKREERKEKKLTATSSGTQPNTSPLKTDLFSSRSEGEIQDLDAK